MPGVSRLSADRIAEEGRKAFDAGIPAVLLFCIPESKDEEGVSGYQPDGVVQKAVAALKQNLGREYGMFIDGKEVFADEKFEVRSPINTDWVLGRMQKGNAAHAQMAIAAARRAAPAWGRTPWQTRVKLVRKAAALI